MSVASISRSKLAHNMSVLQRAAGAGVQLWPAVKANAYGHGAVLVSSVLAELGYTTACVAQVQEAVDLLHARTGMRRLLVLSGMLLDEAASVAAAGGAIEPVVSTREQVMALARAARASSVPVRVGVHVKVDTGMSRQGCLPSELPRLLQSVADHSSFLDLRGVMSHFAAADAVDPTLTKTQLARFHAALSGLQLPPGAVRHVANSAGILMHPDSVLQAARPGIAVYGLNPGEGIAPSVAAQLRPVLELRARVMLVKTVPAGTGVSYGHHHVTERPQTRLATLALGYGDGLSRAQSGRMRVLLGGAVCPQLGRVTMDQIVVDASAAPASLAPGDEATVIGEHAAVTADTLARQAGTINYEVLTALSARVRRKLVL